VVEQELTVNSVAKVNRNASIEAGLPVAPGARIGPSCTLFARASRDTKKLPPTPLAWTAWPFKRTCMRKKVGVLSARLFGRLLLSSPVRRRSLTRCRPSRPLSTEEQAIGRFTHGTCLLIAADWCRSTSSTPHRSWSPCPQGRAVQGSLRMPRQRQHNFDEGGAGSWKSNVLRAKCSRCSTRAVLQAWRWWQQLPREAVHLVRHDELKALLSWAARSICAWQGVNRRTEKPGQRIRDRLPAFATAEARI